jgi:hypothetical protein
MRNKLLLSIAVLIILCYAFLSSTDLIELLHGKKTTYLDSSSSLAEMVYDKGVYFNKTGFSVELEEMIDLGDLLSSFGAKILFVEDTTDGTSYYAYSPKLKHVNIINKTRVNLHVHVSKDKMVVGSPLIFGSF